MLKGWRVIDNTEIVLGPLWQERENERKHLKVLVQNVQQKLNDIQVTSNEKQETITSQRNSLEHYMGVSDRLQQDKESVQEEITLLKAKFERVNAELSATLSSTQQHRDHLELNTKTIEDLTGQFQDAKQIAEHSVKNEKLVRGELNEVYEKLRQRNAHHSVLEKENIKNRNKIIKLEEEKDSDQKRITYLLRKIDTLFHKLSVCRAQLENSGTVKHSGPKINNHQTVKKLGQENSRLTRHNQKLRKEAEELRHENTDMKISLRNMKLSRDLLQKRVGSVALAHKI